LRRHDRRSRKGGDELNGEEEEGGQEEEEVRTLVVTGGGWRPSTSHHAGGGNAPSRLCLNDLRDLARLETAGTNAHALRTAFHQCPHRDKVGQPAASGELVGVTDRVADGGTFPAHITPLSHDHSLSRIQSAEDKQVL